jgi:hypothetical protein
LFGDDGTVTFLDFGCVKRFTVEQVALMQDIVRAVVLGNGGVLRERFIEAGMFDADHAPDAAACLAWYAEPFRLITGPQPFRVTAEHVGEVIAKEFSPVGPAGGVVRKMQAPGDFIFMGRVDLGLMSVLGELEPTGYWGGIQAELDFLAPPCTPLGEADAEFWGDRHPLAQPPAWAVRR